MKKKLVALLLVLAVVSVGLFANSNQDTDPKTFEVKTVVQGINMMRISDAQYTQDPPTPTTFKALNPVSLHTVTAGGSQSDGDPIAWISTISNSRVGYKVNMTATAMKSSVSGVNAYINYTVTVGGKSITTTGNDTHNNPVTVIDTKTSGLAGLNAVSLGITMIVNEGQFASAVEGTYTGEVKFEWSTT